MRTQTLSLLLSFTLLFLLPACGNKKTQELTEENYLKLKAINESISDVSAAVDLAFNGKLTPSGSLEKVSKMANLIRESKCRPAPAKSEEPPGDRPYDVNWTNESGVAKGGTCILGLNRNTSFDRNRKTLSHVEEFAVGGDLKKESLVQSYFLKGDLTATSENALTTVTGDFRSQNFQVEELGLAWIRMRSKHTIRNNSFGSGTATLSFQAKDMKFVASVAWSNKSSVAYRINGKKVDEKTMRELFSSYGLMEMVDRGARIR